MDFIDFHGARNAWVKLDIDRRRVDEILEGGPLPTRNETKAFLHSFINSMYGFGLLHNGFVVATRTKSHSKVKDWGQHLFDSFSMAAHWTAMAHNYLGEHMGL